MTNDFTDDYPRCDFCGKTLFFLDGHYRCPEESSHRFDRHTAMGDALWTQAIYDRIVYDLAVGGER